ncbi:DUF2971 domain-containing protein [Vibrio parahaemolyticus]|nr:DUF2971 domain-containing protein [Vibrio parahaemolyticus]
MELETVDLEKLKERSSNQDPKSMVELARRYINGIGLEKSLEDAYWWLNRAAKLGNPSAQNNLACLLSMPEYSRNNDKKSFELFRLAANQGHDGAKYNLGLMYLSGKGTDKCNTKAFEYLTQVSDEGYANAQYLLSEMYLKNKIYGGKKTDALPHLINAAEHGHEKACCELGSIYEHPSITFHEKEVDKDLNKAIYYYKKSANVGHKPSMFLLIDLLYQKDYQERGEDFHDNLNNIPNHYYHHKRLEYIQEESYIYGSEQEKADLEYELAICYKFGIGINKDESRAEDWFNKSYFSGRKDAIKQMAYPYLVTDVYPLFDSDEKQELGLLIRDAFSHLQEQVGVILDSRRFSENKPLYHFTKWPAISSMLPKYGDKTDEKNVIRLYHEDYMNDPHEGKSFLNMAVSSLLSLNKKTSLPKASKEFHSMYDGIDYFEKDLVSMIEFLIQILRKENIIINESATYLASFTKESDRLDLWRAYGNDGDGFCIKVNFNKNNYHQWSQAKLSTSEDLVSSNPNYKKHYTLYEVSYDEKEKKEAYNLIIKGLLPIFNIIKNQCIDEDFLNKVNMGIYLIISETIYLYKDHQYSSEHEVRIIERLELDQVKLDESEIGKLYGVTPPILFNNDKSEIVIGPKVENKRAVELSIRKRLLDNQHTEAKVTNSTIPYR